MRSLHLTAVFCVTAAFALPATAAAQARPPAIRVAVNSIAPEGHTRAQAAGSKDFVAGKAATHYLHAGSPPGGSTACNVGQADDGVRSLESLVTESGHVWQITTTPISESDGRFVFDLDWKRYAQGSTAKPVASGRHQLALTDGQQYVIDLVHAPGEARCSSVIVDVQVRLREDPLLSDEPIQYDLWLVHTDPAGRKQTRHVVLTGLHGTSLPFGFSSLRFETPRLMADQYDLEVVTRVAGEIRGRLAQGEFIELELSTSRRDTVGPRGSGVITGFPGRMGRKVLTLQPGEAVEIDLPVGGGTMGTRASARENLASDSGTVGGLRAAPSGGAPPPAPATLIRGNSYVVNFGPFFEGHRVTVIVQAKRQE